MNYIASLACHFTNNLRELSQFDDFPSCNVENIRLRKCFDFKQVPHN